MIKPLGMYWFHFDSMNDFQISANMRKVFGTFEDTVAGDKKLFKYFGSSGFVRQVISKPSRLGLWMY